MTAFTKRTLLLVCVQAGCLGIGLWLQHRQVIASLAESGSAGRPPDLLGLSMTSLVTFSWTSVLLSIAAWVVLSRLQDESEAQRNNSVNGLLRQSQSLVRTRDAVIFGLAKLADSRDEQTGEHLDRIAAYATTLAAALRTDPRYAGHVTPAFVQLLATSAALHDIGKVGIEDAILRKPGPLTDSERIRMQQHTAIGARCLEEIEQRLGSSNFLEMARQIALRHHEHWDGTGYPDGLAGEKIPLAARIVAIADVYDALSSRRIYKGPISHERCVKIITDAGGSQFDPHLVRVWLDVAWKFRDIARHFGVDLPAENAQQPRVDLDALTVASRPAGELDDAEIRANVLAALR
ncbi:MAG: HD domain-containing protein [Phycisphaerae bacterium]